MKRDTLLRHALIALAITLAGYVLFYQTDRWLRLRKGPWRVTFEVAADGTPALLVAQERLGIAGARLEFPGERVAGPAAPQTLLFDSPLQTNLPFGRTIFLDTTYLPGAVTLDLFGHEIELLPRTLVVNRREVPWPTNRPLALSPAEKPPARAARPRPDGR